MNEKQLEKLIKADIESSAPDKDMLWEKIEKNLTPKETTAPGIKITPKKSYVKIIVSIAACAALLIGAPKILSARQLEAADTSPQFSENDSYDGMDFAAEAEDAAPSTEDVSEKPSDQPLDYKALSFPSYSETIIECHGTPYGGSYFVEENVLSETEHIIDGTVKRAFASENGDSICYEIQVRASYPEAGMDTIIVESCSPYKMSRGRQYLIPVAGNPDRWHTAFDNVPQIEFTSDGGMVYYNGWSALGGESLIYPQRTVDDYFYDRMMFSYTGDYSGLIRKFYDTKNI